MKHFISILKWIAIVTGATIAILLVLNAYFVWNTGTRLERRLTELRQAGDPVQIADFARVPVAPEKNADVYLRRAADDLDASQKELLVWYPKTVYPTGTLSAADQERLERLFAAYPPGDPGLGAGRGFIRLRSAVRLHLGADPPSGPVHETFVAASCAVSRLAGTLCPPAFARSLRRRAGYTGPNSTAN
jgi:hypothetical protein